MDELAVALKMDPIELRRVNDTQTEPIKGLPYTSRALLDLLRSSCRSVRLERAQSNAGVDARGRLARWVGMRSLRLSDPDGGGERPRARLLRTGAPWLNSRP